MFNFNFFHSAHLVLTSYKRTAEQLHNCIFTLIHTNTHTHTHSRTAVFEKDSDEYVTVITALCMWELFDSVWQRDLGVGEGSTVFFWLGSRKVSGWVEMSGCASLHGWRCAIQIEKGAWIISRGWALPPAAGQQMSAEWLLKIYVAPLHTHTHTANRVTREGGGQDWYVLCVCTNTQTHTHSDERCRRFANA